MPDGNKLKILAVGEGDPFHRRTWSGTSYWFLSALKERGVLVGAIDARLKGLDVLQRIGTWSPDRARWRQRYWAHVSPFSGPIHKVVGMTGTRRARAVSCSPDAVLQGNEFEPTGGLTPRLRCSYSDMHLALFLTRPDNLLDPSSRLVRQALDRERRTFDKLDIIFTMSDWLRESIINDSGQDPAKVVTIWTGANIVVPPAPPTRELDPPRFLFVGMRFDRKGGMHLLEAWEKFRPQFPEAELWIVGPETPVADHDRIRWFGRIDRSTPEGDAEMKRLYTEATAFVMPSVFEPAGIVFLEAMAHALPCIGTDCCAMSEFIAPGRSGFLAERADSDDLADQMVAIASQPERARQMGEEGFRRLSERFMWNHVTRRLVETVEARLES